MASKTYHYTILAEILLGLLMMVAVDFTVAQTGVCFGRNGGSLPPPVQVVDLYNRNNIRRMRIYDPDQPTLRALAGSDIELMIGVSNTDLPSIAANQDNANNWVQNNVISHPAVRFRYISVGNEVSPSRESRQYLNVLLPALRNIQTAISRAGLGDRIRVSTAIDFGLFENTYPPANGAFTADARSFVEPIIRFLADTRAPILLNLYPYFAYVENPRSIDLQYALLNQGTTVPDGTRYQNLLYAMLDAAYAAVERLGVPGGSSLPIVISESGWPSAGDNVATLENARTYNTNLVRVVRSGTPRRAGAIETYVFAMFDEDRKDPEIERNFGLFRPTEQQPKLPTPVAVLVSAAVFTAAHVTPGEFPQLFVLGADLGFSYSQTRNLLTPITIHAFWNSGVILILTFLQVQGYDIKELLQAP